MSPTGPADARVLFLIPARGGSKGLPGKNLSTVAGIPLVGRAARLGRAAMKRFSSGSRVVCSTDDPAIAAAATDWGAEVPFMRPPSLASDGARSIDVVYHALDALRGEFDAVILLQPTSPLTEVADILGAFAMHLDGSLPVMSVCLSEHPAEWLYTFDSAGHIHRLLADLEVPDQRQKARQTFRANGAVYVSSPMALRQYDSFIGPQTRGFVMPLERSIDIDRAMDLDVARVTLGRQVVRAVAVANHVIGPGHRCFVVADIDSTAARDFAEARAAIDTALAAGADAVSVEHSVPSVAEYCHGKGIPCVMHLDQADLASLGKLDVSAFRLTLNDGVDSSFACDLAEMRRPVIVETGTAPLAQVGRLLDAIRDAGNSSVVVVQNVCRDATGHAGPGVSNMSTLREAFGVPAGIADSSGSPYFLFAAAALGADVIEVPMRRDRAESRRQISQQSEDFGQLIAGIRAINQVQARSGEKQSTIDGPS